MDLAHPRRCISPDIVTARRYGMPSGHSAVCGGMLAWLLLEVFLDESGTARRTRIFRSIGLMVLFVPVPFSRIFLKYHTHLQVTVGFAYGSVMGLLYYVVLRVLIVPNMERILSWRICRTLRIRNTYHTEYKIVRGALKPALMV